MSVAVDIARSYLSPQSVVLRRASGPVSEPRALVVLMAGCLLMFAAQWPLAARDAYLDPTIPIEDRLTGALFGWLMLAPLFFYVLAMIVRLISHLLGGRASGFEGRMALFWAVLAASPLWLLTGLVGGFIGRGPAFTGTGLLAVASFFAIWAAGVWAVERPRGQGA